MQASSDKPRKSLVEQRAEIEYQLVPRESTGHSSVNTDVEPTWGQQVLDSHTFMNVMGVIIVANGIVIGLETDIHSFEHWDEIEAGFLVIFIAEIIFKMYVEGWLFFHPSEHDFLWNIFDIIIVGFGMLDSLASMTGMHSAAGGFATIFRMVRLLRVLRVIKLLKFLQQLYMLAIGLVEACKAIIWVTILMGTVLYVLSIVLVKTVGAVDRTDPHYDFLIEHFDTIPDSMITLFTLMSSPNLPIYQDETGLLRGRPFFCLFLVVFITFGSFGMIAMLTGVINESMFENNEIRKQEKRDGHEVLRKQLGKHAADLYETLPLDSKGCVKTEDLIDIIEPAATLLHEAGVEIAHGDIVKFLTLMDDDEVGFIDMAQFVHAMEKIAEGLGPLAILEVQHYAGLCNRKQTKQLEQMLAIEEKVESQIQHTSEQVERILQEVTSDQFQHRSHLIEHLELQMIRVSREVDKILNVHNDSQSEHRNHRILLAGKMEAHMERISEIVDKTFQHVTIGESMDLRSCGAIPHSAGDSASVAHMAPEFQLNESGVSNPVCKWTEDVVAMVQGIIERKFSELEKQLTLRNSGDTWQLAAAASQMQDMSASLHKLMQEACSDLKLDEILCSVQALHKKDISSSLQTSMQELGSEPKLDEILCYVQDLNTKEDAIVSLSSDLARLMQESRNFALRVATLQEDMSENMEALTSKVSWMEQQADSLQTQMLSSVAELGGDIISSLSELVSTSMTTMKQELALHRFHVLSSPTSIDTGTPVKVSSHMSADNGTVTQNSSVFSPSPILQQQQSTRSCSVFESTRSCSVEDTSQSTRSCDVEDIVTKQREDVEQ